MEELIEHCMYESGLTADGCWDELDDYAKEAIQRFAKLLMRDFYNDASMLELRLRNRIDELEKDSKRLEWIIDNLEWASLKLAMISSKEQNWRNAIDKAMERDAALQKLADQAQECGIE